ncbi:MAG TPA: TolC family protein [Burkholderiales bacterium]|nr:TolC family protein [Burkholderiales bacterium]
MLEPSPAAPAFAIDSGHRASGYRNLRLQKACGHTLSGSMQILAIPIIAGPLLVVAVLATSPTCAAIENGDGGQFALTMPAAEAMLLDRNHELIASRRALEGAQADRITAGQRPNPELSFQTLSINPRNFGSGSPWDKSVDSSVQLSQSIERGNKRALRSAAADHNVAAANSDLDDMRRQQMLLLRQTYLDVHLARERVSIGTETVLAFRRTLDAANIRLKSGDIASADVSRISVDSLRAENDLRQSVADLERARVALAYLIGMEARAAAIEAIDPWPAPEPLPNMPGDTSLDSRPDVRAALARADAAGKAAQLAAAQRSRDVTVFAQFEHFPGQQQNNTIGFGVSVPLFLGNTYEGEIRRAEADRYAAQDNVERARALARADVAHAWSDLASARDRVERFDGQLLASARKAADASEFAYKRGALGVMDLLDARRALNATQLDSAAAHADYAKALAAWRAATTDAGSDKP